MIWLVVVMLLILLAAGAVVVYVAYPYRHEAVPRAHWPGRSTRKGADPIPRSRDGEAVNGAASRDRDDSRASS